MEEELEDALEAVELYDQTTDNHTLHLLKLIVRAVIELMEKRS